VLAIAVIAVLTLAAAACGDDDNSSSATTVSQPTGTPIKVGMMNPTTNTSAPPDLASPAAANAWAQWTNANGGINGHPVQIIVRDTKGDPSTAQAVAKDLVETEQVTWVLLNDSSQEAAVAPYLTTANVPVVEGTGYSPSVWGKLPTFFSVTTTIPATVQDQIVSAAGVGAKAFGVISCAENPNCSAAEPLYQPTATALGLKYAGLVKAAFSQPNFTAECLQLKNNGADFVQISASAQLGVRVYNDCQRQGYTPFFGASGGTYIVKDFADAPDMKLAGGINSFPWWVDDAPVKEYRDAMAKYANDTDIASPLPTAIWASLSLTAKALANAPATVTRQTVFDGMYALNGEDLGGLLPVKVTYSKTKGLGINCFYLYKQEKTGQPQRIDNGTPSGNSITSGGLKSNCYPAGTPTT